MITKNKKGFTLIELLVVVAILGLLATIVAVSLTSARARARDARRVSDIRQIELALELYHAAHQQYPSSTVGVDPYQILIDEGLLSMSDTPKDPKSGDLYCYASGSEVGLYPTQYYHIAAKLENAESDMLTNDLDAVSAGDVLTGTWIHATNDMVSCDTDAEGITGTDTTDSPLYDRGVLPR